MFKLKTIIIIVIVILTLGIAYKYYRKLKDTEKLKLGETSLKPVKEIKDFNDIVDVLKNGLRLTGF
ncbi:MAG: hypothetical protein A2W91_04975 [Bacteroidetes bacterium GWF2_38_335]|nr:MAG: hypothetical protein A2W91_04975 [Bacteroidetes bacterium GWF2_38_335]OFY79816.1 MAG: hypothetical protein A2281_10445 [Bacteroidetes bacterium RIFOXYA12_FULL_38_20]